jgi:hypothetical protein
MDRVWLILLAAMLAFALVVTIGYIVTTWREMGEDDDDDEEWR